jgi:glyoxylase-like metal-dependent hydrolase (beta-lactamase superfamily II)
MFRNSLWPGSLCLAMLLSVTGFAVAPSASPAQRGQSAGPNPLAAHLVKTGLFMFSGDTNSLVRLSANGVIVVDGQTPDHYDALRRHIRRVSELPIRLLITTDHHQDHTASNGRFLADGAQILAQNNVKQRLATAGVDAGAVGLPTRTYDEHFSLTLGGIEVRLMHFGNARTDGDSVVYFPDLKVVAVGDLLAGSPEPDFSAGGSMVGWGPVLGEILKLDFDVVVPSKGPTATRADLVACKARIDTLVARARTLVKYGVTKEQLPVQLDTADLGWRLDWTGERLDRFYEELSSSQ